MKVPMGPPPPQNPNPRPDADPTPSDTPHHAGSEAPILSPDPASAAALALEPLDEVPSEPTPDPNLNSSISPAAAQHERLAVPYTIPPWSEPPGHPFFLEVLKDGAIIEQLDVSKKGAYMFGRLDLCDFVLEHPTISRFHSVLQFKKDGEAFLYDLGSTHGTSINKKQVKKKVYIEVHVGDVIRFGNSSRLYIFQGPLELMPPEGNLDNLWRAKIHEEMLDREASLLRAKNSVSLADGISWGMDEDAIEEAIDNDADEVTWQTYKGQLTERQEKTRGKVIKRLEKVANMKKEIDAIRAKDIAQGGLTQGQQTQIARNEQRISQIMEELENLEDTLNESIQESLGARSRKVVHGRKKVNVEEGDAILSDDDDEFYDRTKKKRSGKKSEQPSVETADTLLVKKEALTNAIEEMKQLLLKEKDKLKHDSEGNMEGVDDLDAYMSGLSSQLVLDKTSKIEDDLSNLQTELDKITYLLKVADPTGEAVRKRDLKAEKPSNKPSPGISDQPQNEQKDTRPDRTNVLSKPKGTPNSAEVVTRPEEGTAVCEKKEDKVPVYTVTKPQWLGDTKSIITEENQVEAAHLGEDESDDFVDYRDRNIALGSLEHGREIENAAPGLIIRKRKPAEDPEGEAPDKAPRVSVSSSETTAADAVALLLKHGRGLHALDDEGREESEQNTSGDKPRTDSKPRRVLGPPKPDFLETGYEKWVPPKGQTGDGRTSLNDRLGY